MTESVFGLLETLEQNRLSGFDSWQIQGAVMMLFHPLMSQIFPFHFFQYILHKITVFQFFVEKECFCKFTQASKLLSPGRRT